MTLLIVYFLSVGGAEFFNNFTLHPEQRLEASEFNDLVIITS